MGEQRHHIIAIQQTSEYKFESGKLNYVYNSTVVQYCLSRGPGSIGAHCINKRKHIMQ